jgi:hypothetical protein
MNRSVEKLIGMASVVLLVVLGLLGVILLNLGGQVPALKPLGNATRTATEWPTPAQVGGWFAPEAATRLHTQSSNAINPFHTLHFQPPPPPTTRPAELTYLGYFRGGSNAPRALLLVDAATLPFSVGSVVVADHRVAVIALRTLVLTNATSTNVLEFNLKKTLIVPIK